MIIEKSVKPNGAFKSKSGAGKGIMSDTKLTKADGHGAAPTGVAAQLANAQSNRFARDFSHAVGVLMRDKTYRKLPLGELEWLLIPPLLSGQYRVAISRLRENGPVVPVGLALWAHVSDALDKRLSENLDKPLKLESGDWTSGNTMWLTTLVGPAQVLKPLVADLKKTEFKGRTIKFRSAGADGLMQVKTLTGAE
jgi:cytolysin-activating lysine-acyltransferase